jgi:thiamine-monophosphate kinase
LRNQFYTSEHKLIESIREWSGSAFIGDDCAVVEGQQLLTTDSLVEGTHFLLHLSKMWEIGWKAVAVNLSDIAAMAGCPRYLMISLTVPEYIDQRQLKELYAGMVDCARSYRTKIAGGDLTKGPVLTIAITVLGETHESGCLRRSGAKPGDVVFVTGDFGASRAGLWALQNLPSSERSRTGMLSHCIESHLLPVPHFFEAWELVKKVSGRAALMDASDGLADALVQLARASSVGMSIDISQVPVHDKTREICRIAKEDINDWILYGGEDYQLVGTMDKKTFDTWNPDNPFKKIGMVTSGDKVEMIGASRALEIDLSRCFQQIND